MSKLNKILLIIVGILLIALIVVIYWQKIGFQQSYWAVYLNTGDLYFGKLHRFPKLSLSNVWLIQRNPNDQQNPFSLARFTQAFWGPEDKIYLNEKNIIWKTRLSETSQVLQYIKNQPAAQAQPSQPTIQTTPQQLPQQPSRSATTTQQ